jgi:hypothetical protein
MSQGTRLLLACLACQLSAALRRRPALQIIIGRNVGATMQLNDGEISGQHASVRWSSVDKCWKVGGQGLRRAHPPCLACTLLTGRAELRG